MKKFQIISLILFILICLSLLSLAIFHFLKKGPTKKQSFTVTLTKNGFRPNTLTIFQDDTVVFKTTRGESFWPASDFHPSHSLYPEFDPKRAVSPKDSWSFVFNKIGTWRYHDHLLSSFKGTVTVLPRDNRISNNCSLNDISCWKKFVEETVEKEGLSAGFDLLDKLPQETASVRCHDIAHFLGDSGYKLYSRKIPITIQAQKLSQCGFGFYHGFLTTLYANTKDLTAARRFCDAVKAGGAVKYGGVETACYHGLGHGLMEETPSKQTWGDPYKIVAVPIQKCLTVTSNKEMQGYCTSGVFNSLAVLMVSGQYGLSYDKSDPYKVCNSDIYRGQIKDGCYSQMNTVSYMASGGNMTKGIQFAENINDKSYVPTAMSLYSAYYAKNNQRPETFTQVVKDCRTALDKQVILACIFGYANGLIEFGAPPKEYEKSIQFCSLKELSSDEKVACVTKIGWFFKSIYNADKVKKVCSLLDKSSQKLCTDK